MIRPLIILACLLPSLNTAAQEPTDDLYMDAFVVVADTSQDYHALRTRMFSIAHQFGLEIDTMGRGYDEEQKLITLPHDDEDELYAGDYFPRRYPSEVLSLEYLDYYSQGNKPTGGTIALIVAITSDREQADMHLAKVKPIVKDAFILEAQIYIGCMH